MASDCFLHSLAARAPETRLSNADLASIVDTTDEWIVTRTGIRFRRKLAPDENASDLGAYAARECLKNSGVEVSSLTHIVAATCTPNYLSPSVACIIAGELGATNVMAFDFNAACSGFIYGLSLCRSILAGEPGARVLFVCAEAMTRRVNWRDRGTCVLFGDAATACLIDSNSSESLCRVVDVVCDSDGAQKDLIIVGGGSACQYEIGQPVDEKFFISMRGRDTYKQAVRQLVNVCETILERNDLNIDNIDLMIPHQANMRIIEAAGARLGISPQKVFANVGEYGNTSAASIPLALKEAWEQGRIKAGAKTLVAAFGAGLTWGAALLNF